MRGIFIIGFAVFIDALQGMFALAFIVMQFVTPWGGGISGALAAGYYCWSTSAGILSGIANAAACATAGGAVGAGVSAFAVPIGAAVDVALSVTLGGALIAVLAFSGMFYPGVVIGAFLGESLPLLNAIVPGWTLMAWRCTHLKNKEEKAAASAQAQAMSTITDTRRDVWEDIRSGNSRTSYANDYAQQAA